MNTRKLKIREKLFQEGARKRSEQFEERSLHIKIKRKVITRGECLLLLEFVTATRYWNCFCLLWYWCWELKLSSCKMKIFLLAIVLFVCSSNVSGRVDEEFEFLQELLSDVQLYDAKQPPAMKREKLKGFFMEDAMKVDVSLQIEFTDYWKGTFTGTGRTRLDKGAGDTALDDVTVVDGKWYPDGKIEFKTQGKVLKEIWSGKKGEDGIIRGSVTTDKIHVEMKRKSPDSNVFAGEWQQGRRMITFEDEINGLDGSDNGDLKGKGGGAIGTWTLTGTIDAENKVKFEFTMMDGQGGGFEGVYNKKEGTLKGDLMLKAEGYRMRLELREEGMDK